MRPVDLNLVLLLQLPLFIPHMVAIYMLSHVLCNLFICQLLILKLFNPFKELYIVRFGPLVAIWVEVLV
jgi:hypothetical protein